MRPEKRNICFTIFCVFFLELVLPSSTQNTTDFPCKNSSWIYVAVSGTCYKGENKLVNVQEAHNECSMINKIINTPLLSQITLGSLETASDMEGFGDYLSTKGNSETHWTNGRLVDKLYRWNNGTGSEINPAFWNNTKSDGKCVVFIKNMEYHNNQWKVIKSLSRAECNTKSNGYICQHRAEHCKLDGVGGPKDKFPNWNADTMRLDPPEPYIGLNNKILCKNGFYRLSDFEMDNKNVKVPIVNCTGEKLISAHPKDFKARWELQLSTWPDDGKLQDCKPVHCTNKVFSNPIQNVLPYIQNITKTEYYYGEGFDITCQKGYAYISDTTQNYGKIWCDQSHEDPRIGVWRPYGLHTCVPVMCPQLTESNLTNLESIEFRAFNYEKQKSYSLHERNQFPFYPNRVYVQCKKQGYFFSNRRFEQTAQCNVKLGNPTVGEWHAIDGTDMVDLRNKSCIPVTCQIASLIVYSNITELRQKMNGGNFIDTVTMRVPNQLPHNISIGEFIEQEERDWRTEITFYCSSNSTFATGNSVAKVICNQHGFWEPQLTNCIYKSTKVPSGQSKYFIPKVKEANQAVSVGAVIIIILVLFLSLIIILDLSTLQRDLRIMKRNIRILQRWFNKK